MIMRSRPGYLSLPIASCLCLMAGRHDAGWATTNESRCPVIGSVYRPDPDDLKHGYLYRLRIEGTSPSYDPTQSEQNWHFQLLDRNGKKRLAESILMESCPTGGLCTIAPRESHGENPYSVIVELTDEFHEVPDFSAPRVIILPGFVDRDWDIGHKLGADGSVYGKVVWARMSCGR